MTETGRLTKGWGLILALLAALPAAGATYYVDFEAGADTADGLSPQTAFKHCPGDPQAADKAGAAALQPGDTVVFKGGAVYRGLVVVQAAGEEGRPIVFDGNTAGRFGRGRAIVDGSEPLGGWKPCASPDDCGGNPRWPDIYYTSAPAGLDALTINLTQGDRLLAIAQEPNPDDPLFEDVITKWRKVVSPRPHVESAWPMVVGKGLSENKGRPYVLALDGELSTSALLEPCAGAALTVRLRAAVTAGSVAVAFSPESYDAPKDVVFLGDDRELLRASLAATKGLQKFTLRQPATFKELTLKVLSVHPGGPGFGALAELQAYDQAGGNVLAGASTMVYRDASCFEQSDPQYWSSSYFVIYARPSQVYYQKVLGFDPQEHKLTIEALAAAQYPTAGAAVGKFSMMNAQGILDRPGEFYVEERGPAGPARRLYVWPLGEGGQPQGLACSRRSQGFEIKGARHVTIQGFKIQKQGASRQACAIGGGGAGTSHIVIRDNEVTLVRSDRDQVISLSDVAHCTISGNYVHENRRAGAVRLERALDCIVADNILHRNGATAVSLLACRGVKVLRNVVTDHKGQGANGLTAYQNCQDILFEGNRVSGGNVGLALQDGDGITVAYNIIDGGGANMCLGFWNVGRLRNVRLLNNLLLNSNKYSTWEAAIYGGKSSEPMIGYVIKNNVIDGTCGEQALVAERSHNIYTRQGWNEMSQQGWRPADGEMIVEDLARIFADPARGDYRLKPGSPAIDAGVDVGYDHDLAGNKVPQGRAPDIGAYQYVRPAAEQPAP